MVNHFGEDMTAAKYDVLIIGGGLVGASLLCALETTIRQYDLKVGLIENHDLDEPRDTPPSYDARASALSYGTRLIYDQLGLWQPLEPYASPILDIHVSERGSFGAVHLNHQQEKVSALGYVVENFRLGEVLLERLKHYRQQKLVDVFSPAEVSALKPLADAAMNLTCSASDSACQSLDASLVVLADGGRSALMNKLHIRRKKYDYEQHALVTNVSLDRAHNGIAYERFAGDAPMALLPLTENRCGLVWTIPSQQIGEYLALDDDAFLKHLQKSFGYRAGRFIRVGKRDSYPLTLNVAQEQVRPGLVVLGNAAHAMHPVAGQGYNLAIRDTLALAETITRSLSLNTPLGNLTQLLRYVERQESDQKVTLGFCDKLVKLFARKEVGVILARNLGLASMDLNSHLKSRFARKAMGI